MQSTEPLMTVDGQALHTLLELVDALGVLLDRLRAATSPAAPPLPLARTKAMAQ